MSVRDAVSRFVHKGDFIASGGFGHVRISVAIGGYGRGRDASYPTPPHGSVRERLSQKKLRTAFDMGQFLLDSAHHVSLPRILLQSLL